MGTRIVLNHIIHYIIFSTVKYNSKIVKYMLLHIQPVTFLYDID